MLRIVFVHLEKTPRFEGSSRGDSAILRKSITGRHPARDQNPGVGNGKGVVQKGLRILDLRKGRGYEKCQGDGQRKSVWGVSVKE